MFFKDLRFIVPFGENVEDFDEDQNPWIIFFQNFV